MEEKKDQKGQKPEEDIKKDLDDILDQLSEKGGTEETPRKQEPGRVAQTSSPSSSPAEEESATEGVEAILEQLSERPEETAGEAMGVFQRIIGVFFRPAKVFESLRRKPDIVVPLILVAVVTVVVSNLVVDIAINDQIRQIEQNETIPDDQKDLIIDRMEASRTGSSRFLYTSIIPVLTTMIVLLVVTGVFLGIGNFVLGGAAGFKQMFSIYLYAYLILAIAGNLVKVPLWLTQKTLKVQTSLAILLPTTQNKTTLYTILSNFDVFTLWFLVVFGIGFATLYRFSQQKGIAVVFSTWLTWVLVKVALGGLLLSRIGGGV